MKIKLVLTQSFENTFNDIKYYIYQFVDPQTLTILSYSSREPVNIEIGQTYTCTLGIKKTKLYVSSLNN